MNLLKRWTGLRLREDWVWEVGCQRPTLTLRDPARPGWYLLTVRLQSDTLRSYGLINRQQGRILVSGKRRRRLVHIGKRSQATRFEILGLDDDPLIAELRLVPQPWWRVRKLMANKLLRLHPAYRKETLKQRSFSQQSHNNNSESFNEHYGQETKPSYPYPTPLTLARGSQSLEDLLIDYGKRR